MERKKSGRVGYKLQSTKAFAQDYSQPPLSWQEKILSAFELKV